MNEIIVPELAESISEGTIANWLKKEGDIVQKGEPIVELETDKVNIEIMSENDGVLKECLFQPGDTVKVGQVIAILDEKNETEFNKVEEKPMQQEKEPVSIDHTQENVKNAQPTEVPQEKHNRNNPVASPAARKKARELGIDLNDVPFQDPLGRVKVEGVEAYKHTLESKEVLAEKKPQQPTIVEKDDRVERIKMSRRRQTIAKRLVEAQQTAAMLTTFNEVDMSAIMDVRNRRKDAFFKKNGVKLGFMSFFYKSSHWSIKGVSTIEC